MDLKEEKCLPPPFYILPVQLVFSMSENWEIVRILSKKNVAACKYIEISDYIYSLRQKYGMLRNISH